ncbi:MAG: excinuclease ABC subunit UvrC [Gammaproteobacteria bacterium]|nr:excinuclease ABC subunit UvrC [Gammaproteobacteria bacterium]
MGLPKTPGVYRFFDQRKQLIYVGKARNLRRRVASYFSRRAESTPKLRALRANIANIEFTVTRTEGEALLLESNLIKEFRPRYNVVLRDDKSYPYIHVTTDQQFPRLAFHRGARSAPGRYFGPYPSAGAVRQTLNLLQKLFRVRQCEDSYFANRSRPCLQHQIDRCTAPCVGLVAAADYDRDIQHAVMFLEGRSQEVIDTLVGNMEAAATAQEFERAARLRDQIFALRRVQQNQYVTSEGGDFDIVAAVLRNGVGCVQVFFVRSGSNLGNKTFFPVHTEGGTEPELLAAFLSQYYLARRPDRTIPPDIIVDADFDDRELLADVLAERRDGPVRIRPNVRGERARWLDMARNNAEANLAQRLSSGKLQEVRLDALREALGLAGDIARMECFDISHTRGERTVASCVVFDREGPRKSDYRLFNIEGVTPGDDYAAMNQAVHRRYARMARENAVLPDIILIDGGAGQVNSARAALAELGLEAVCVIGVAKGPARRPGQETLILQAAETAVHLPADAPALHAIQHIRDEAHRFAISGHRQQRGRQRRQSPLERIEGVGAKRRQQLIKAFGGLQGVARAGVEDLARVNGISHELATRIYQAFHES